MTAVAPAAQSSPTAAPREPVADPELSRLRTLLRMQIRAAAAGSWAAFGALSAAVRDELDRRGGGAATPAALAEVAHLQLRLELLLQGRARQAALRLSRLAAQSAYRRMSPAPR